MKTVFLLLTLAISLIGQTYAQNSEPHNCSSGGVGMNLTYSLSPISNGQYRMDVTIANPFSKSVTGVFILSKLSGLYHYRGVGKLSNGNKLSAEIIVDYSHYHEVTLIGFSNPTNYSITFGCN